MEELPERLEAENSQTYRHVSEGAERWLMRPIPCLDHGFLYLVDYMGSDDAVVQAARVSYGKGTKKVNEDKGLIRYLRRHLHTTPSEMVEVKFHAKHPIFVARQWIRHRTANVNEYSGRYSEMLNEFYVPERSALLRQSKSNKQGRAEELSTTEQERVLQLLKTDYERSYLHYQEFLGLDLAKELARMNLAVANYTQWYWKIDLHNLFHFLRLRLDNHAQYEVRVYAEAMARIVKDAFPISYQAFEDYQLHAMNLTRLETNFIKSHLRPLIKEYNLIPSYVVKKAIQEEFKNKRETDEFVEKLRQLGFVE